jgi:phosphohistidine phosphatase
MEIHLMRHGLAIDREHPSCPPDPERFLTDTGLERTRSMARGLVRLRIEPELIVTSPWVRAVQTTEIVAEELDFIGERRTSDALLPDTPPADFLSELTALHPRRVLVVGHAPQLDRLLAALLGLTTPITQLKKAGVASLRRPDPQQPALLTALFPPRALRRLGRA